MDDAGFVFGKPRKRRGASHVVVELRYDSAVGVDEHGFVCGEAGAAGLAGIDEQMNRIGVRAVKPLIGRTKSERRDRVLRPRSLDDPVDGAFAHCGFAQVFPRKASDVDALARQLNRAGAVWSAHVAPRPVHAGSVPTGFSKFSRNFEPSQGYLHSGPYGLGTLEARHNGITGWDGLGIRICDIETGWNFEHEDLARPVPIAGGDFDGPGDTSEHGTAVMGMLFARPDRNGMTGMTPRATGYVSSAIIGGNWNTAGAITAAARRLRAGDVMIIELQDHAPSTGKLVAMQLWPEVFSAIRDATAKGITVVQAAGNGNENFDRAAFKGTLLQRESGAVTVGAGVPPTNSIGFEGDQYQKTPYQWLGPPRSRLWFSNYGSIVDVQAWGWHVSTLGYGDAQGGTSRNRWYTHRFSGTSSAAPMIAGLVASIQSRAKQTTGSPLPPQRVREILIASGWDQEDSPHAPLSQRIGPQPDLAYALDLV